LRSIAEPVIGISPMAGWPEKAQAGQSRQGGPGPAVALVCGAAILVPLGRQAPPPPQGPFDRDCSNHHRR
jgi:hypothetical protein